MIGKVLSVAITGGMRRHILSEKEPIQVMIATFEVDMQEHYPLPETVVVLIAPCTVAIYSSFWGQSSCLWVSNNTCLVDSVVKRLASDTCIRDFLLGRASFLDTNGELPL